MTRKRKAWLALGTILSLLLAVPVAYLVMKEHRFHPAPPDFGFSPPVDRTEARRQDLEYLRHFPRLDYSFSEEERRRARDLIDELLGRAGELTDAKFELGVSRVVALADNGHTNVWSGPRSRRFGRLPIRGYWFADGYHVVRARNRHRNLLGAEIAEIDGRPIGEVVATMRPFVGGTETYFRTYHLPYLLEAPALLHAAGVTESPTSVALRVESADGEARRVELRAEAPNPDAPREYPTRYLSPAPMGRESDGWQALLESEELPIHLAEGDRPFRHRPLQDIDGYYVQYRQNHGTEEHSIEAFNGSVTAALRRHRPGILVVDLRFDYGGDYTTTSGIMARLPDLVTEGGKIYALTGGGTFSAGINSLAFLVAAGGDDVVIVGERIGDRERHWGETNRFVLPNSGIGMSFATGMHDLANGCWDWRRCYWSDFFDNVAVGSLDPDVEAPYTFTAYVEGRDPAMEAVRRLAR